MISIEHFSDIVNKIHRATTEPSLWQDISTTIGQVINASMGGIMASSPKAATQIITSVNADGPMVDSYGAYYRKIDPILPSLLRAPDGTVITQSMVIDKSRMVQTEFYNGWLRPRGLMDCLATTMVSGSSRIMLVYAIDKSIGNFDEQAVSLLQLLSPHLQTAMRAGLLFSDIGLQRDAAFQALDAVARAMLLVDSSAVILAANTEGEKLLTLHNGLFADNLRRLLAADSAANTALHHQIALASGKAGPQTVGGTLLVERPFGGRPLMVTVAPISQEMRERIIAPKAEAIVIVALPPEVAKVALPTLQEVFGLTPMEAQVAQGIAQGKGLPAVAAFLGIAPSTAKSHLLRVFVKTDTKRQADLVLRVSQIGLSA